MRRLSDVLYNFEAPPDAEYPYAGLLAGKKGEYYGTTWGGGNGPSGSEGTVYEITATGKEKVLYNFQYGTDGASSQSTLIMDKSGALYGETAYGGGASGCTYGCGTVFKLTPGTSGWTESVLYALQGGSNDGVYPVGGLVMTKGGALLGTTFHGGGATLCGGNSNGCGVVFELTPSGSTFSEKIVHAFKSGPPDGLNPVDALVADSSGNLYGTTLYGGLATGDCKKGPFGIPGCGTVFKLTRSGSTYTESVLYRFKGGTDGRYPRAGLLPGPNGVFYGLTEQGGAKKGSGNGTFFELKPNGSSYKEKAIYSFQGGADGSDPDDTPGLVADTKGNLYGTTALGGGASACSGGCGTIFKLTPSGSSFTESVLYAFQGGTDGVNPYGSVVIDSKGKLLGPTYYGGSGSCEISSGSGCGTIFSATP
ncbi:MAG: choice-of-anchor tandem repeat GloVer-containing protein [Candidatus Baltobacteraceae bacterium]